MSGLKKMFNTDFNFYGTILIFSFIINAIVTAVLSNRNKLKFEEIIYLLLYEFIGIILGGKYYTLFTQYSLYKNTNFLYISMSSLGAFIGAFVMVFIFSKQFKISYKKVFNVLSIDEPRRVDCENPGFSFSDFLVDDTVDFDRQINLKFLKSICNEVVGELVVTPKTKKLKLNWEIIYNTIKTYIKTQSYVNTAELLGVSKQYVFIIMEKFRARLRKKLKEEDFI